MGTGKAGVISLLLILLALTRIHFLTCGFDDVNGMNWNGSFAGFGVSPFGDWIADAFDVPAESTSRHDKLAPHVPADAGLAVKVLRQSPPYTRCGAGFHGSLETRRSPATNTI